MMRLLKNVI